MNHSEQPLDPREDALVRALAAQAETVRPAGDGLVRIQARVERRRSRTRWLVPSAGAAAVAATVTAVVASGVFTSGKQSSQLGLGSATLTAATTPTVVASPKAKRVQAPVAAPTPVATTVAVHTKPSVAPVSQVARTTAAPTTNAASTVASDVSPLRPTPVWPFGSVTEATEWQKSAPASEAWHLDAVKTAEHFVDGLKLAGVTLTGTPSVTYASNKSSATVVLQRKGDATTPTTFATVQLSHWSTGDKAPWGVVSVTSSSLNVTQASNSGPIQVSAPGSTEGTLDATVYQAGTKPPLQHSTLTSSGTVTLPPAPSAGSGFVVLTNTSGGGSTPSVGSLAVVQVQLTAGTTTAASTYVAVVNAKLEVLDAATGAVVRTLVQDNQPFAIADVTSDGTWAYYSDITMDQYEQTCQQPVRRVRIDGTGMPETAVAWTAGALSGMAVGGPKNAVQAWVVTPCGTQSSIGASIHWRNTATGASGEIDSPSSPPLPSSLAVSADGSKITAFLRSGTAGNLTTFSIPGATTIDHGAVPSGCTGEAGAVECLAAGYDANGDVVLVRSDGQQFSVLREHAGTATPIFSVTPTNGTGQFAKLDLDPATGKILLIGENAQAWLWDGTKATPLPAGVTDASW